MAKNTAIIAGLTGIFSASLDMASEAAQKGKPLEVIFAQKGIDLLKIVETRVPSKELKIFNTFSSVSLSNIAFVVLKNVNPSKVLDVGAMVKVQKIDDSGWNEYQASMCDRNYKPCSYDWFDSGGCLDRIGLLAA
ncbi:hypothetical protein [Porphyrobacter sp. AAP60]|uniref:hypothetical protein n=1 Tax=Porphyrobacter sp. AAP60 TaxID=1523423 RepID=UPI0006B9F0EC|nr:hypothetical protein [Porphyrobacter sp. AAP60]KPF63511.1 hypothetical protein IP79_06115 [Porphyrobacter sp. AAP60]